MDNWRKKLTRDQYHVLREKGTEPPFSGIYDQHFENGVYSCGACNTPLFASEEKYDAGCGWPSFTAAIESKAVEERLDESHGMVRTEVVCANCGSHLGHAFPDGPPPSGIRYCINSLSLQFTAGK